MVTLSESLRGSATKLLAVRWGILMEHCECTRFLNMGGVLKGVKDENRES
jgi:hypothetical protein